MAERKQGWCGSDIELNTFALRRKVYEKSTKQKSKHEKEKSNER